jgi:beta-aspartyl-peptidase (threonine type)
VTNPEAIPRSPAQVTPVVAVHGGAGGRMEDAPEAAAVCERASNEGLKVLRRGGSALDAAQRAIEILEDAPILNAGTGAALNDRGEVELDASLMEGTDLRAGAVAALSPFRNPIAVARAVLEDGAHVLYAGSGADEFARSCGFEPAHQLHLKTPRSVERLLARQESGDGEPEDDLDTVGAVAVDHRGRVAAGTSTGGTVGQRPGRIGDSPLIGCGTYADDEAGACSTTGMGEAIIRECLAFRAVALLRLGVPPIEAATATMSRFESRVGGRGGLILAGPAGEVGFAKNTPTMPFAISRLGQDAVSGF